jgi:hypothetical protein
MRALGYARALRPLELRALHIGSAASGESVRAEWATRGITVPIDVDTDADDLVEGVRKRVREIRKSDDEFVTVVLPEVLHRRRVRQFVRGRRELMLKASMLFEPQVVVTDVPTLADENGDESSGPIMPTRNVALVLVSGVHNATLRAIAYANAIRPSDLRGITFNTDDAQTQQIMREWTEADVDVPLEVIDSPYREVTAPLVKLIRQIRAGSRDTVVTIVVPEFVVSKWYHQFLHNQTALAIKGAMLFEPGVVVTSVPYHLR